MLRILLTRVKYVSTCGSWERVLRHSQKPHTDPSDQESITEGNDIRPEESINDLWCARSRIATWRNSARALRLSLPSVETDQQIVKASLLHNCKSQSRYFDILTLRITSACFHVYILWKSSIILSSVFEIFDNFISDNKRFLGYAGIWTIYWFV